MKEKLVCISGGFDPIHIGHIRYIQKAAQLGTKLWAILNTDDFLLRKKGYVFMSQSERKEVLWNIKGIDNVVLCIDKDNTVCKTLEMIKPNIFAKGGDRTNNNIPEASICEKIGIKMYFGIGGYNKPQSSSWLINNLSMYLKEKKNI